MIIHIAQGAPVMVRVLNSLLPGYTAIYGDGLGNVIHGLFRGIAQKAIPIAKQFGMKAIKVVRGKGIGIVGDAAGKAFSAVRYRLARLVRGKPQPVKLPSKEVMPASVSKIIKQAADERLRE